MEALVLTRPNGMEPNERIELSSRRYEGRRPSRDIRQVGGGMLESNQLDRGYGPRGDTDLPPATKSVSHVVRMEPQVRIELTQLVGLQPTAFPLGYRGMVYSQGIEPCPSGLQPDVPSRGHLLYMRSDINRSS